jgi:hypothetical protein
MPARSGSSASAATARRRSVQARRSHRRFDVFLNVPFDRQYESLLIALVAGLTAFGLTPRCVLEIPPREDRLRRLHDLLSTCQASVHDLSRVGTYGSRPRCARFNMPFELGLAVARSLSGERHFWIVLEEQHYRVQKSLSDINGFDPYVHGGTTDGVLQAIADAFHQPEGRNPSIPEVRRLWAVLRAAARELKRQEGTSSLFSRRSFGKIVLAAQDAAIKLGIVRRG